MRRRLPLVVVVCLLVLPVCAGAEAGAYCEEWTCAGAEAGAYCEEWTYAGAEAGACCEEWTYAGAEAGACCEEWTYAGAEAGACCEGTAGAEQSATQAAVRPERTISLFDGKSLDAFETWLVDFHREDPLRVFSVVDQVDGAPAIRISGERWGGLITRDAYRDYRLIVEFRWGLATWGNRRNAARDSGVLVHGQGPPGNTGRDGNGPWVRSIEAQIIEGGVGDIILVAGYEGGQRLMPRISARARADRDGEPVFDPTAEGRLFESGRINWSGRDPDWQDTLGFRGTQDVESPFGEWTRLEVVVDGDRVTNIVNGKVVNEAYGSSLSEGRIMIQCEGAEIYFRRIVIEPLGGRQGK